MPDGLPEERGDKEGAMKRLLVMMVAMLTLVVAGCGDGSVTVVVPISQPQPPTIESYQFTKNTATQFVLGSVNYFAPDSDIDTMTVTVFTSSGIQTSRSVTLINQPNVVRGTISFSIDYVNLPADAYTFSIFLTDFNGLTSNQVVDTFRVP